jgi:hypothetical protein
LALEFDFPDSAATQSADPQNKSQQNNGFTNKQKKKNEHIDDVDSSDDNDAVVIIIKVKNNNSLSSIPTLAIIKSTLPVVCFNVYCLKRQQHNLQA